MRGAELRPGRRYVVVLEPGEELLGSVERWCREHGVRQALVPSFFGAFRDVSIIATTAPLDDDEPPLRDRVSVGYVEGVGSGAVAPKGDATVVHLHAAVGVKRDGGAAVAGHVLAATAHYTVEVVVEEVLEPEFALEPHAASAGLDCLVFPGLSPRGS